MGEFEKTLDRLRAAPPLANFNDVRKVLEHFGWEQKRQKGSHVIFTKKGDRPFSIPLDGGRQVKRTYVQQLFDRLRLDDTE